MKEEMFLFKNAFPKKFTYIISYATLKFQLDLIISDLKWHTSWFYVRPKCQKMIDNKFDHQHPGDTMRVLIKYVGLITKLGTSVLNK